MLHLVLEHPEVAPEVHQRGALVVELDLQRAFLGLRYLGDRRGRVVVNIVAADQAHDVGGVNHDARQPTFTVVSVLLVGNLRAGPVHHLADVAKPDLGEFANDLLNGNAGPLSALGKDLINPCPNQSISKQARSVHVGRCANRIIACGLVRSCCGLPLSDFLSEPLMAAIGEG